MPIQARLVMLQSGMRAPMGVKVQGSSLEDIERFSLAVERVLKDVPSVRSEAVFAERVVGKPYLEVEIDREALGRYGLSVVDVQELLEIALGGVELTRTVEGRARYPVRARVMREHRDSVEALGALAVPTPSGEHVPLGQVASVRHVHGPDMIRAEDTFLTGYVLFDRRPDVAELTVVEQAEAAIRARIADGSLEVPPGVRYGFAGSYENQVRSEKRLMVLLPVALLIVFMLLYLQFRRTAVALIIFLGTAAAGSGGFSLILLFRQPWFLVAPLLWLYGQTWFLDATVFGQSLRDLFQVGTVNLSVAVWIGVIALIGIATDDGVVISTYLRQRFDGGLPSSVDEVRETILIAFVLVAVVLAATRSDEPPRRRGRERGMG